MAACDNMFYYFKQKSADSKNGVISMGFERKKE